MVRRQREYDADVRHLASMRAFLSEVCRQIGQGEPVDQSQLQRLALALTEAASNIILHGYQGQRDKTITLIVEADDDQVCVTLQHTGTPFDPQSVAPPVFDGSQESGFGLHLIRKCVDEVEYCQDEQGRSSVYFVQRRKQHHKGEEHAAHN